MANLEWSKLYSNARIDDTKLRDNNILRTSFTKDYDRIIFSSAFRRLQNKTQVFPLPGVAFVHNRLTHSLEVASVGRSLGKTVGQQIADAHGNKNDPSFEEFYRHELSTVISAACLAHDIGNPPFGHSGEEAIRSYFLEMQDQKQQIFTNEMTANQWADFTHFEGNSNAFRLLTHPFNELKSSFNITQTTLASIVKYPSSSLDGFDKNSGCISQKKSGFFDSECATWNKISEKFGLFKILGQEHKDVYVRHPFVYLTEAADDICYRIIDMEDALRLGILDLDRILALFLPFFDDENAYLNQSQIATSIAELRDPSQKLQYLRAVWIGRMVSLCAEAFMNAETELLAGTVNCSLIELLPERYTSLLKIIDTVSNQEIYQNRAVVEIELAGYHVIGGLLDKFVEAILNPKGKRSEKMLQLIPKQYANNLNEQSLYQQVQAVTDFVSGMTDIYAIDLYRKITGISIKGL